jgi:hypothetical protein
VVTTRVRCLRLGLLVAGFSVLTSVLTWPLVAHLWDHVIDVSVYGPVGAMWRQDVFLTLWILSWGTHALSTDPTQLWHANVLRPMAMPLAGSEHLLGYQWLFAPLYLTTGNPVLAQQLIIFLTFVFTGVAMALLVREVTGSEPAAWVAGCALAFCPWRFGELSRVQMLGTFYLPLVVLCLARYLRRADWRALAGMSVCLVLQALTSFYLGYFAFAIVGLLLLPSLLRRSLTVRQVVSITLALGVAGALLIPIGLPYARLRAAGVIPTDPYADPSVLAFFLSARPWLSVPRSLGVVVIGLGLLGCRRLQREMWPGRAALLTLAAGGYVLVLGPALPIGGRLIPLPYRILGWFVPGLSAVRYPMRFGLLIVLAVTLLAGRGVAYVAEQLRHRTRGAAIAGGFAVIVAIALLVEARTFPGGRIALMPVAVGTTVPPVYGWLRDHGDGGVVVEVPVGDDTFRGYYRDTVYMYFSTYHWQPLVNGFTGYPAPESSAARATARRLPDPAALQWLRAATNLRWVVVHRAQLDPAAQGAWSAVESRWHKAAEFGGDVVLDVASPPA